MNAPSCPWKITATVRASIPNTGNVVVNGLYLYDGTKLEGFESLYGTSGFEQRVEHITNVSTDGLPAWNSNQGFVMRNDYESAWNVQIRDDCTNYYFDSSEEGVVFYNLFSEPVGTWLTATKIGFGADQSQGAASAGLFELQSWQVELDANLNGP